MKILSAITVPLSLTVCVGAVAPCPEGINLLPKYGRAKKCRAQIELDKKFITQMMQRHGNQQKGAEESVRLGWEYLTKNQVDAAMKRFNQAWLLDSLNAEVDWGFGTTLRMQGRNEASLAFFRTAIARNYMHNKVWRDAALSYGNVWGETKQVAYLDTTISYLKKSILLDNKQAYVYADLAHVYHFCQQADSAKKYLMIADKINPNQVDWETRKLIMNNR